MRYLLAVDIGGTKTLFQLSSEQGEIVVEQEYISQKFADFVLVFTAFIDLEQVKPYVIDSACFAVAGPVSGRDADVTNLPWKLNADDLAMKFNIRHVHLCNDFEAVGYGIACLANNEIITLQQGEPVDNAPRAVIGAGTGLGQALLLPEGDNWQVVATEGGHVDFAPTDRFQIALLEYLSEQFSRVSYECIVSGIGLVNIYEFLRTYLQQDENSVLRQAMMEGDPSAAISQFADEHQDKLASLAMNLFFRIYGAQAGNLALTVLPKAGLYIAGGIVTKNLKLFQNGAFMNAFVAKGKMESLMIQIPVRLILQPKVGLMGARLLALQNVV